MYKKERLEQILKTVKENGGYVTVKFLVSELHYSNATINRDLNVLENQKKIIRSYGGVELSGFIGALLPFRYHKMRGEKLKIAKKASEFVKDGDTIFIDGSTTAEYMKEFIKDKKDLTVITNNMVLAMYLSDFGVKVVCLGGQIVEKPSMLDGVETIENASKYYADKMFFSVASITDEGLVGTGETYYLLHKTMAKNSKEVYYLVDGEKVNRPTKRFLFDLNEVQTVISDYEFKEEMKTKYPQTSFIKV